MLTVGKLPLAQQQAAAPAVAAPGSGPAPPGRVPAGYVTSMEPPAVASATEVTKVAQAAAKDGNTILGDEDSSNPCSVQLRGLPFRATVSDIRAFLGEHVHSLNASRDNIRLLQNRDGRPSGFARVFFTSPQAAQSCRDALHRKQIGDRYIEVLATGDRNGKARNRRSAEVAPVEAAGTENGVGSDQFERERILRECREHMSVPGQQQLLLSMLGIALSEPARNFLKRQNLGLKHFLARHPHEFRVEGPKGGEKVFWMSGMHGMVDMSHFAEAWPMREPSTPERDHLLMSPARDPGSNHSQQFGMATPSDWGTPGHQALGLGGVDYAALASSGGWPPYWPNPLAQGWNMPPWPDGTLQGGQAPKAVAKKAPKTVAESTTSGSSHAHLHPQAHPFAKNAAAGSAPAKPVEEDPEVIEEEAEDIEGLKDAPALRLRGLPFSVTVQDVLAFFAQHNVADRISDVPNSAQLLPKANGRPSGQAVVQMRSRRDAEFAQKALSNQYVGQRYIEVFVYGKEGEDEGEEPLETSDDLDGGLGADLAAEFAAELKPAGTEVAWPEWANMFSQAAPWAVSAAPWTGLVPPPVPGGPPASVDANASEAKDTSWDNLFMTPGFNPGVGLPSSSPPEGTGRPTLQV